MGWNELNLKLTDGAGNMLHVPTNALDSFENLSFQTLYGLGGRYGVCKFDLPDLNPLVWEMFTTNGQPRLQIRNWLSPVYEGWLAGLSPRMSSPTRLGFIWAGAWGQVLAARGTNKDWADDRMGSDTWPVNTTKSAADKVTYSREQSKIRFVPKAVSWANNDVAALQYIPEGGEAVKRLQFDYDMAENTPTTDWTLSFYDVTNAAQLWSTTTTSSGTVNQAVTAAGVVEIELRFSNLSGGAFTPPADGTEYGEISNLMVFTSDQDPNDIDLENIASDIVTDLSGTLSADTDHISSASDLMLEPFGTFAGHEMYADVLARAAALGDASFNTWAVGVLGSWEASDSLPALWTEAWPALTAWDLEGSTDELGNIEPLMDVDAVRNWIAVTYSDKLGNLKTLTPDDNANLKNDASITAWGQREQTVTLQGSHTQAEALNFGRRILSDLKDPAWRVTKPAVAFEKMRIKGGGYVGASQVYAGQRLRVVDVVNDLTGRTGATFQVVETVYNHARETVSMKLGRPDKLAIMLAQNSTGLRGFGELPGRGQRGG